MASGRSASAHVFRGSTDRLNVVSNRDHSIVRLNARQPVRFDPRNNVPRIGRVLIARGRDAADVAIITTFGPNTLERFQIFTDEIRSDSPVPGLGLRVP